MTTTLLQPYDIYNLNTSFKREKRNGLFINDALIRDLEERNIHYSVNTSDNRISKLFVAYPELIQFAMNNQDVVLVDNTNKTNKFDMPVAESFDIGYNRASPENIIIQL